MEKWKLTDKEMQEIIKWVEKIAPLDMQRAERGGCEHTIAKAAQKKLVEWADEYCVEHHDRLRWISRRHCFDCWNELRIGVGVTL